MPGPSEEAKRRIREALLDLCSERGYRKLKLKHLLERSGVKEEAFKGLYADLDACFTTVLEEIYDEFFERLQRALGGVSGWRNRMRATAYALLRYLRADERVALLAAVEVTYGGKRAQELFQETFLRLVTVIDEGSEEAGGPESPSLATAIGVGGVVFARIQEGAVRGEFKEFGEEEVPQLMYAAVFPYLGAEAAEEELHLPPPPELAS